MKYYCILLLSIFVNACSSSKTEQLIPKEEAEALTLAYINLNKGTTECKNKLINNQVFSACHYISMDSKSGWQVWYYDNKKDSQKRFYAINGSAGSTYDNYLKNNSRMGDYGVAFDPQFKHIDVEKIVKSFDE